MNCDKFNQGLLRFLAASPTPFHAVKSMCEIFAAAGFFILREEDSWQLEPGGRYLVVRNDSSIIALVVGTQSPLKTGIRLVGAHTDSPCLKVKPRPEICKQSYFQLGVEVYGGALLNPWFDRDLSLAGRVIFKRGDGQLKKTLLDFKRPVAVIPSLAIHLDREANENRTVNPQLDIPPILLQGEAVEEQRLADILSQQLAAQGIADVAQIVDYELSFYDTQPPAVVGLRNEFIASARLDNLLSCYTGMQAMLAADPSATTILVCNDHEEVGSASACGAAGPMLASVLERLIGDAEDRTRVISQSLLISADNAHGVHPNYADKHDNNHGPVLNHGPVIKVNSNQRYATSSVTASLFREFCDEAGVQAQTFVTRSDMGCGSTIGPITAREVGVPTLDIGVPTFAMHSIRELAGARDAYDLYRVLKAFYASSEPLLVNHCQADQ